MTPMIWPISPDERSIAPMARMAACTISPDWVASRLAEPTRSRAWVAPSAVFRTVAVISSRAAAVSSREAACCSVRRDRSSAAWLISTVPRPDPIGRRHDGRHRFFELRDGGVEIRPQRLVLAREGVFDPGRQVARGEPGKPRSDLANDEDLLVRGSLPQRLGLGPFALP